MRICNFCVAVHPGPLLVAAWFWRTQVYSKGVPFFYDFLRLLICPVQACMCARGFAVVEDNIVGGSATQCENCLGGEEFSHAAIGQLNYDSAELVSHGRPRRKNNLLELTKCLHYIDTTSYVGTHYTPILPQPPPWPCHAQIYRSWAHNQAKSS